MPDIDPNPYKIPAKEDAHATANAADTKPIPLTKKYDREMTIAMMVLGGFFMLFSLQYIGSNKGELLYTGGGGLLLFLYGLAVYAWKSRKARRTENANEKIHRGG